MFSSSPLPRGPDRGLEPSLSAPATRTIGCREDCPVPLIRTRGNPAQGPSTDLPFISIAVEGDRNILGAVKMFGSLSCDHGYFQLSPRKVLGRGEKERETVTRAPSLEATRGQARPGESFLHSLAAERASPPEAVSPAFAQLLPLSPRGQASPGAAVSLPHRRGCRGMSHTTAQHI